MPDAIFISYRRDDSEGEAGRLFDDLTRIFGSENVFMDVAGIQPGADFRKAIESSVANCGVLLAIIGPIWATLSDSTGQRRLDAPNDFVALEIANALARDIPVIPVLVHDARMPQPGQLPDALKLLAYRNSIELSHTRWNSDLQPLIAALKRYTKPIDGAAALAPEPARTPQRPAVAQRPSFAPAVAPPVPPPGPKSNRPMVIGLSVAGLVLAGIFFTLAMKAPVPPANGAQVMPVPSLGTPPMPPDSYEQPAAPSAATRQTTQPPTLQNTSDESSRTGSNTDGTANKPSASLAGTWVDTVRRDNNSLDRLVIQPVETGLALHAFGSCPPAQCDWGIQPASVASGIVSADFYPAAPAHADYVSRKANVKLRPDGATLEVTVENTFMTNTGFRTNHTRLTFVRAPQP